MLFALAVVATVVVMLALCAATESELAEIAFGLPAVLAIRWWFGDHRRSPRTHARWWRGTVSGFVAMGIVAGASLLSGVTDGLAPAMVAAGILVGDHYDAWLARPASR